MTSIRGAATAVTGAASGIGRALALELAARGCNLALADRDEAGLRTTAEAIGSKVKVTTHRRCRRARADCGKHLLVAAGGADGESEKVTTIPTRIVMPGKKRMAP